MALPFGPGIIAGSASQGECEGAEDAMVILKRRGKVNEARRLSALPIWLSLAFIGLMLVFGGMLLMQSYRTALRNGEVRAAASAQTVAANAQWMMEASNQALQRIDAALSLNGISTAGKILDLEKAVGDLPIGFNYAVFDAAGHLRFSSVGDARSINIETRGYFAKLAGGQDLAIGRLTRDNQIDASAFTIARRVMRDGQFQGVAAITISNAFVDRFWRTMGLGANSTVSIIRDDGWLMARHPEPDAEVDLGQTAWFAMLKDHQSGIYHSPVSPIDGISRIVAFQKIDGWPVVALAAIDRAEVLDQFWQNLKSQLLIVIPFACVLSLATAWIVRLLHGFAIRNNELERALERNTFLFREIHHRVKNNLQTVQALVRLQPLSPEAKSDVSRRIAAMVSIHEQIYQTDQFETIEIAPYVNTLVTDIASSFDKNVALDLELEAVAVDRDHALPLGMLINEVVSNAFKYAFNDTDHGWLKVRLSQEGLKGNLVIRDNGPGYDPLQAPQGMGSKLIAGFIAQLGGELHIERDNGMVFRASWPIA
ncbi:sensor histidine kinase [Rhizobium halophytocola]|uniref:histidine kinase n=1 Tax=Rhizobium halophytocola TaxID=735519 RepID=A0ABS4DUF3_9HYPH|nr:histidine kinase dimerization/phosphoacceptor domain -containing protein [Rhizobium halophytocola]MBP1849330.1 two-component sensor histidine kinase [Rhizobium halophytocola]